MWISRTAEGPLRRMVAQFPAVLVTGPRQSGKTALLRRLFPAASYVTLDVPAVAAAAGSTPEAFLEGLREPAIIDEVQYVPALFRSLKARIDRRREPGRFLLTGSQAFGMMRGASESLAGRCGVLSLASLSWAERAAVVPAGAQEDFLFMGGFPELHAGGVERGFWYSSYVATYLERDVRNMLGVGSLGDFDRFLRAAALRTSQLLNYADLARDVGVSPHTAKSWLSALAASGQVFLLEAYHRNLGKRLVKSPKLHFADTGLAAFLMGFRSRADALSGPLAGALWESFVAGQAWRRFAFEGVKPPLWHWHTPDGREVDLVVEEGGGRLTAVECKLSEAPGRGDCAGLRALESFYGPSAVARRLIACRAPVPYEPAPGVRAVDGGRLGELLG